MEIDLGVKEIFSMIKLALILSNILWMAVLGLLPHVLMRYASGGDVGNAFLAALFEPNEVSAA